MNPTQQWYEALNKPPFAPPSSVFGVAWGILYPIIFVSFGYVFYLTATKQINWVVALPFALNLILNFLFSPVQFGLRNNELALGVILGVIATLIWAMVVIYPVNKWVFYAQIPYLLWGLFATTLQVYITLYN